jgi:hypothetical protein
MKSIKRSLNANKNVLIAIAVVLIGSVIYNSFNTTYHAKEIDVLKDSIALKEKEVQVVLGEKEKYQDSSAHFEQVALQYDHKLVEVKHKVEVLKQQKADALHALNDIPKDVIDSFFVKRYAHVQKVDVDLDLDVKVGNAIVKELTEKDFLIGEVTLLTDQTKTLTTQVDTLRASLSYSKQATGKADIALKLRSQQLNMSENINKLLEKDLKTAKRKAFWGNIKGIILGLAAGITVGVIAY